MAQFLTRPNFNGESLVRLYCVRMTPFKTNWVWVISQENKVKMSNHCKKITQKILTDGKGISTKSCHIFIPLLNIKKLKELCIFLPRLYSALLCVGWSQSKIPERLFEVETHCDVCSVAPGSAGLRFVCVRGQNCLNAKWNKKLKNCNLHFVLPLFTHWRPCDEVWDALSTSDTSVTTWLYSHGELLEFYPDFSLSFTLISRLINLWSWNVTLQSQ